MAMGKVYTEIKGKKVKELPSYFKPMFWLENIKTSMKRGLDNYNKKYIHTSYVDPLPKELDHMEHQQHYKKASIKTVNLEFMGWDA